MATEHPQLAANGADMVDLKVKDAPALARLTTFQVDRPITVADPALQALLNEKREIDQKIEALRINKGDLPEAEYEKQMEELLVQLAMKNQQIKDQEKRSRETKLQKSLSCTSPVPPLELWSILANRCESGDRTGAYRRVQRRRRCARSCRRRRQ